MSPEDRDFIFQRDNLACQFCGLDGTKSYVNFQNLQFDHLLPKGHANRDSRDFIVLACGVCNNADNRYFDKAEQYGLKFDGMSPGDLVEQRRPYVTKWREEVEEQWRSCLEKLPR